MTDRQRSLSQEAAVEGTGLHTGEHCRVVLHPAAENHGLIFRRRVKGGSVDIRADISHVVDTERGTVLEVEQTRVHTVEHLLAALAGLGIDNCLIELSGPEPPVLDGSCIEFISAIKEAGIVELEAERDYLEIDRTIVYHDETGVDIVVVPSEEFRVTYMVDYRSPALGTQYTSMYGWDEFEREFAPARTFCFLSELLSLKEQGLIKGGSLDNALIFADLDSEEELERLKVHFGLADREIVLGDSGILDNVELRFPNEPVRHKVLDLAGDLCLLGQPFKGHVLAARGGHRAHVELIKLLKQEAVKKSLQKEYQQRITGDVVFDTAAIERILPHRYPFLLVDRITELKPGEFVRGIKSVSASEPFFQGHFPGHPIMPGVLIVESMGQTGGILLLNSFERPEEKVVYFTGLDKVRFRRPVRPGDQIVMELRMLKQRRGMCYMEGKAFVEGELAASAEMTAVVMDK